jgi:hypothetical protein
LEALRLALLRCFFVFLGREDDGLMLGAVAGGAAAGAGALGAAGTLMMITG